MWSTRGETTRDRRRGTPLWLYLTALALVPLVGVAAYTGAVVRTKLTESATAARAETAVRAVGALGAARSGVEHEVIPVLEIALIDDPAGATALGIPRFLLQAQRPLAEAALADARAATDAALDDVPADSAWTGAADQAATALAALRSGAAPGGLTLQELYVGYLDVSEDLAGAQRDASAAAGAEEVRIPTYEAMRDVQLIARLAQSASRLIPLFVGAQIAGGTPLPGIPTWQEAWQDYLTAAEHMDELGGSDLQDTWARVSGSADVVDVDSFLAAQDGAATALSPVALITLVNQSSDRDALLTGLLQAAVDDASGLAAADRAAADVRRDRALAAGITVLVASLLLGLLLGRRVSRSLGALAGAADQISEGALVEVEVRGPREVRRVSSALGSAVAGLRRIQRQAEAVARGDLTDSVLDEPLPGPLGEVVHASVEQIVQSVRQREELRSALAHQAAHDALTGLPNRAQGLSLVTAALHRAQRSGATTGLLFVDLDGFKAVNDRHGHACGDEVLREVARRMQASVRPGDAVCRLGGDEFVVLVEAVAAERDLVELAARLIDVVSEPIRAADQDVRVGASVGIALGRDGGVDPGALVAEADTAAYRAKRGGRGRAELFDDTLRAQLAERAAMEAAIASGLAGGEMTLHYQPVVDVASHRVTSYEALLRWQRPGVGMVPPDAFIPIAESSRLICDIDRWVLGEATRQLAEWRAAEPVAAGEPEPTIAVNVSGRHLADPGIVDDVAAALAAAGLPGELLVLEVTETVLVDDPGAFAHLAALREIGVRVAIDDFGTGYTSIGQLRHMPIDTLKIDRSFVASDDPGHRELVALMIRAAHTFGLTVVAEGVEEPEQLDRLRAEACDHAQGYLLSRPLPPADARAQLRTVPR